MSDGQFTRPVDLTEIASTAHAVADASESMIVVASQLI